MVKENKNIYELPDLEEINRRADALEQLWKEFLETEGEKINKTYLR